MSRESYSLSDIVHNDRAVGVPVIHGGQRLVSLLAGCIPYLELNRRAFVQGDGLCEEGGANGRLAVIIKLILCSVSPSKSTEETILS